MKKFTLRTVYVPIYTEACRLSSTRPTAKLENFCQHSEFLLLGTQGVLGRTEIFRAPLNTFPTIARIEPRQ